MFFGVMINLCLRRVESFQDLRHLVGREILHVLNSDVLYVSEELGVCLLKMLVILFEVFVALSL